MDAVELAIPAVVVSKFTGPEGFSGGGGVGISLAVENVEVRQSVAASALTNPSITAYSSSVSQKESALWNKMLDTENSYHAGQSCHFHEKDALKDIDIGSTKASLSLMSVLEANQLERKSSKVARTSNGSFKRSRMVEMDISMSGSIVEYIKGNYSEPAKSDVPDKSHMPKQKNNSNGKRGDKRNGKGPKSRGDSFYVKNGVVSFSSGAGRNNFLGVYSPKTYLHDVTEHVDEVSLRELLDGSYKCPIYVKDKGNKVTNLNDSVLHSARKVWSILWLQEHVKPQNNGEICNSCNKGDALTADQFACDKVQDHGENLKTPNAVVDLPFFQPKDILERLALPPQKDLDSLLLDAAKPTVSSRNSADLHLGKPVSYRTGLPPFPWSHSSSAHCKSGPDAVKLSSARNICVGRWMKVENSLTRTEESTSFLVNLELLTFNQSLVPLTFRSSEFGPSEVATVPSACISFAFSNQVLSSSAVCTTSHCQPDEHSPQLLAAAQTLSEIAISLRKQNPNGTIMWLKKPSEKGVKNCKPEANEKSEYQFLVPKPTTGHDNQAKANVMFPSKKLKLSVDAKSNDLSRTNSARKGPINCTAPRSIRSSPFRMLRDSTVEMKIYNTNVVNKACTMRPTLKVMDKVSSSQQKLRKVVPVELNPSGSKPK